MPGYAVRFDSMAICGGADLQIRSLLDRQQYSDPEGTAAAIGISSAQWPLFGLLWPSAQKLADLMQVQALDNRRILEMGCGLALASLVIHRRRGDITASDCHPLTETFLLANQRLNAMAGLKYRTGNWAGANPLLGEFDLLIGSDLLYDRDQPQQLAAFIQRHAAQRAEVLIIDPNRGNRGEFHRCMAAQDFAMDETLISTPLFNCAPYRGRLLRYRRNWECTAALKSMPRPEV